MRIALITPEYPSCGPSFGVGRYVSDLSESLREAGATVRVLAATDSGNFIVESGLSPRQVGPGERRLLLRPLLTSPWLNREIERFAPHVVDVPNWGGLGAFLRYHCPCIVRLVTSASDPSLARGDWLLPLRMMLERATVLRATSLISDSAAMAEVSQKIYGRPANEVIHLAHKGPIIPLIPREGPSVLFIGRLESRKGIDVLLDAWAAVLAAQPHAHLHVVGPDKGGFATRISTMTGITWHGFADDAKLVQLRATCRVQVIPSRFESFGLVALEAWAAGMAVVASEVGGLPEVVGDGGLIVPAENPVALSAGLIEALDERRSKTIAAQGRQRLLSLFTGDRWLKENVELYERVIGL